LTSGQDRPLLFENSLSMWPCFCVAKAKVLGEEQFLWRRKKAAAGRGKKENRRRGWGLEKGTCRPVGGLSIGHSLGKKKEERTVLMRGGVSGPKVKKAASQGDEREK